MKVVVVGGGVVGLCSAYSLAKKGFDVVVVDPGDDPSTSTINAGMIVPSHIIPLAAPGMIGVGLRMMLRPKSPFWIRPRLDRDLFRWGLRFARSCTKEHVERSKKLLIQLNTASKAAYLDFEKELDGFHVEQKGLLMIAKKESSLEEESHVAAQVREMGLPADVLDAKQVATIDPGLQIEAIGGVHYVADCHFSPPVFMAALKKRLVELKVDFVRERVIGMDLGRSIGAQGQSQNPLRSSISGLRKDGLDLDKGSPDSHRSRNMDYEARGHPSLPSPQGEERSSRGFGDSLGMPMTDQVAVASVHTASQKIECDFVVLAAGAWSAHLARQIGLFLPLQAGKGYSFNVENPPARPTICAILMEGRVAVTPMPEGVRFGGTMEIGPADNRIDGRRVEGIREAIPNYYPAFKGVDLKSNPASLGLRPCSPDGLPYIGRHGNCIVATGHAMMGMSLGPITGRLVAELAAGEKPQIDLELLEPGRFGGEQD